MQEEITRLQEENTKNKEKFEADLKQVKENAALEKALSSVNAHDIDVIKGLLKSEDLVFRDEEVIGLDKQIEALKKEKAFLFKEDGNTEGANPKFSTEKRTVTGQEEKPATLREAVAAAMEKK